MTKQSSTNSILIAEIKKKTTEESILLGANGASGLTTQLPSMHICRVQTKSFIEPTITFNNQLHRHNCDVILETGEEPQVNITIFMRFIIGLKF